MVGWRFGWRVGFWIAHGAGRSREFLSVSSFGVVGFGGVVLITAIHAHECEQIS